MDIMLIGKLSDPGTSFFDKIPVYLSTTSFTDEEILLGSTINHVVEYYVTRRKYVGSNVVEDPLYANKVSTRGDFIPAKMLADSTQITQEKITIILNTNYPNPFNPVTNISYSLSQDGFVSLKVYDSIGKEVITLVNDYQSASNYSVPFNASNLPSGIYFYTLTTGNFTSTKKMLLVK